MTTYIVSDLALNDRYLNLWDDVQRKISESDDKLKSNYIGIDPKTFLSLPVVILDNRIVCFSGLQTNESRWGKGIGRCSTRMWIDPEYRFKSITRFTGGPKFLNTSFSLPVQLAAARINGLDCVFISRENNLLAFKEYLNLVKINCKEEFMLESLRYNVCGKQNPIPESCKQYVGVLHLTDQGPSRWAEHMEKHKINEGV